MLPIMLIGVAIILAGFGTMMYLAHRSERDEARSPNHHHGSVWLPRSVIKHAGSPTATNSELELRRDEDGNEWVHV